MANPEHLEILQQGVDPSPAIHFARQQGAGLKSRGVASASLFARAIFHAKIFVNPCAA